MDIVILLITLISSICVGHFQYKISKDGSFKPFYTILYAIMLLVIVNINIFIFYFFVIVSFIIEIIYKVWLNKLKLRKRLITFAITVCSFIVIYIVAHITPHNAVRAHLFITGHPIVALTTRVSEANISDLHFKHKLDKEKKYYEITDSIPFMYPDNYISSCVVTKKGFLYFARYIDFNYRDF